jgi:hypothetical protein
MNLVLGICAAVAALVGLGLLWWRSRVGSEIALMASLETSGAGSIATVAPGTLVEVKGTLRVRAPLAGEFSGQPCAYYKCEIERAETYYERDSNGRDQRKTRNTTVYSNMKYGQCLIEDGSGKVGIDFDGADVEAVKVIDEPTAPPGGDGGVIGSMLSTLSNTNASYRRREYALAPDIPVYVLGEVQQGGLIGKPASGSKNKTFVVSHKSEEERTKSLTSTMRWLLIVGVILLVLAVVLAGFGIKAGPQKTASTTTDLILRSA